MTPGEFDGNLDPPPMVLYIGYRRADPCFSRYPDIANGDDMMRSVVVMTRVA